MKSKITIEIDFENNNRPVLQIKRAYSEDTRDNILSNFLELFATGASTWAKLEFKNYYQDSEGHSQAMYHISAITPDQLQHESEIMAEQARLWKENRKSVPDIVTLPEEQ